MTLWELAVGDLGVVTQLSDNIDSSVIERLATIGIIEGRTLSCLQRSPFDGPIVINTGQNVFALERDISQLITLQRKG